MKNIKIFLGLLTFILVICLIASIVLTGIFESKLIFAITTLVALVFLYGINIVFGTYIYFDKKRRDLTKKSWLFALLLLPGIVPLIFLWTGFSPFTKKKIKQLLEIQTSIKKTFNYDQQKKKLSHDENFNQILQYASNITINKSTTGDFKFISDDFYQATINLIRKAKKVIFVNFYIFGDGFFCKSIFNELYKKSLEGVKVFVLYDWVGSRKKIDKNFFKKLNSYKNFQAYTFRKKSFFIVNSIDSPRNHKKSIIVDDIEGIVGGFNIADEYINENHKYHFWRDHAFTIKGLVINDYLKIFLLDWLVYTDCQDKKTIFKFIKQAIDHNQKISQNKNFSIAQTYNSFPELNSLKAINIFIQIFSLAKKRIWINTPYFFPTEQLENILFNAVIRGVDVRVILPGLPDNKKFITNLNRYKYKLWLEKGIKIYEFNGFSHAKTILIDDDITLLGSINLDPRALNINYEILNIVKSKKLFSEVYHDFEKTIKISQLITKAPKLSLSFKSICGRLIIIFLILFEPLL